MYLTLATDQGSLLTRYEDLLDWLTSEPDLRPGVKPVRAAPAPGELGGLIEALEIAVGSGGAVTVLAGGLRMWLSRNRDVHISVRDGDRSMEIDGPGTDVERILRALNGGSDG